MRTIGTLADRMLSMVVPKIKAGACCPPDTTQQFCYCQPYHSIDHANFYRSCSYNCACQLVCGGCNTYVVQGGPC
jgi:hypothetical protein